MKLLLNLLPALCFFITYYLAPPENNLIYATFAIVASSLIAFALSYTIYKKVERMQIVILVILLIFAIPTIYFKDPSFIKWKVSIINIILAIALFICQFGFKKNIAEALTGIKNPIPENLWQRVTIAATIYLLALAAINYVLAFMLPDLFNIDPKKAESIWVNYKTYGNAILNFIFVAIAFNWLFNKLTFEQKKELENMLDNAKKKHLGNNQDNDKKEE